MRTYKKHLPEGVKSQMGYVKGVKAKFINIDMYNEKKKKEKAKKEAKTSK